MEALSEPEWGRLNLLQELRPQDSMEDLYKKAKAHLKSQESFSMFLDDIMSKTEQRDSDVEEERLQQSLKEAFRTLISSDAKNNKDSFQPEEKCEPYRTKVDRKKISVSMWDNMEGVVKDSNENNENNDFDEKALEEILYGSPISKKTEECPQTGESDGDESFHSIENDNAENQNQEINLINPSEVGRIIEAGNENDNKRFRNGDNKTIQKVAAELVKISPSNFVPEENCSKAENAEEKKDTFSFFNQLISKNKITEVHNLKLEVKSENKKDHLNGFPLRAPAESPDQVANIIDHFFYQPPVKKGKETVENRKCDYEKQGAIPKKINSHVKSESVLSATKEKSNGNLQDFVKPDLSKEKEKAELPFEQIPLQSQCYKEFKETSLVKEALNSATEELKIPDVPFIYVVSDDFSPAFRLPKGNYYITHIFEKVEGFEKEFKLLHHPPNEKGKKTESHGNASEKTITVKTCKTLTQAVNKSFQTNAETTTGFNRFVQNVPCHTLDLPKKEAAKNNNANIKGKIFCNTPLQSLKKESDDRNDTADAYGAILQSVADDFKCFKKSSEEIKSSQSYDKELSSPSGKKQKLSESLIKELTPNDYELPYYSSPKNSILNCKEAEENVNEDEDEDDDGSASAEEDSDVTSSSDSEDSNSLSKMKAALEQSDPDYLKQKLKNCGEDRNLKNKVIEQELERSLQSKMETEKILEGYVEILKELPTLEPEYLLKKWTEIAGDEAAIKNFIAEEKLKVKLEEIKNKLISNLPLLDRQFLESKSKDFLFDTEGLESFINEERKKLIIDEQYVNMVNRLPRVDPVFLREKVEEFRGDATLVEDYIQAADLQQRLEDEKLNQMASMLSILPDADPAFLEEKCQELTGENEAFNNLLSGLLENKNYPKVDTDPVSRERAELWRRFVDNFNLKDFLSKVSNPEEFYCGSKGDNNKTDINFITKFLQSRYPNESAENLLQTYRERRCNLTNTCAQLDSGIIPIEIMDPSLRNENIPEPFLLEAVFILHRREIRENLREERELRELKLASARNENSLLTCSCCFEDELLETDVTTCPDGDIFCLDCVKRSVETKLSDAVFSFSCLADGCTAEFTLAILEKNLPRDLYDKVLKKKQSAEVTEAKVPGLETCPSCDFAYIPDEADKVFKCQNKYCLKEICRICKEENHVPLRCEEVERPSDTNVRTKIEEKMTEALVRTCHKCGKKFVKTDGCNKMTCVCGAAMCYLCRKPVHDYTHFNGQGGDRTHLCPLYSNNDDVHVNAVRRVGQLARDEAFRENPDLHLVHDPTKTL